MPRPLTPFLLLWTCTWCLVEAGPVARERGGLRKEEMDENTKAWLLMVESGRVDEEKLRRITPKSVFIAPMLSSRGEKCREGHRQDHLGNCVKIIKIDPNQQLEALLKRLSAMYSQVKEEEKIHAEETIKDKSSGPLQFSIPILNVDTTTKREMLPEPQAMKKNTFEESGSGSGDGEVEETTAEVMDFTTEVETTTEVDTTTTEVDTTTTEVETTTQVPVTSYQNVTTSTESVQNRVRFPIEEETPPEAPAEAFRFPEPQKALPQQEFWWVPPNWRIEDTHKPTLLKFWSRFPLVRDPSFHPSPTVQEPFRPSQPYQEVTLGLVPPPTPSQRRGRVYR